MNPFFDDTTELRNEVIEICREMAKRGLCISTWGNVSIRLRDAVLITPSRMEYEAMRPEDMVVVSPQGERIGGERLPSSETLLHCALLAARPEVPVWVHSHAPHASTLACMHRELPIFIEDMAQIVGGTVGCSCYVPGGRHRELAQATVAALRPGAMAVLIANHGVVVGASNLAEALTATLVLEKAAAIQLAAAAAGGVIEPLAPELVREERERYLTKYGKE